MYVELSFPPGLARYGTERQSKGRFYDGSLVRWYAGRLGPIGGWRPISTGSGDTETLEWYDSDLLAWFDSDTLAWTALDDDVAVNADGYYVVGGVPRAIITWRDNSALAWAGIGTHTGLYVMNTAGSLYSITPDTSLLMEDGSDWLLEDGTDLLTEATAFPSGRADAVYSGGYGSGLYGASTYGTTRASTTVLQDATQWTLDTWGQYLIGCMGDTGYIYEWRLDTTEDAAIVANAPTAEAIVVTGENFVFALGADGNPRNVAWCDQGDNTVWTSTALNQAGDIDLVTNGRLRCGKRVRGGTLLLTDVDVHLATYIGGVLVYGFDRVASGCGAVSKQCVAAVDSTAYWMGKDGFWMYNGYVQPLPCDTQDAVFTDKTTEDYRINRAQSSKVCAVHISAFGEIWWLYPSGESLECNRAVVFNYREGHWSNHVIERTCGTNRDAFAYPLMCDPDGLVYEHEIGVDHDGATVYAESGPIEMGSGDTIMRARYLVPDEDTEGDTRTTFYTRNYPSSDEATYGPYTSADQTSVRFSGRSVRVRYEQVNEAAWRIGAPRLDVIAGGRR